MIAVKQLEWKDHWLDDYFSSTAKTLFGRYEVWRLDSKAPYILDLPHQFQFERASFDSLSEALAAAQAHYDETVISLLALHPSELPAPEWKRKFKGTSRGGAYIHTHPDVERAIVENHNGISFNGQKYGDIEAAKAAALNGKPSVSGQTRTITGWQWQFEASGPWHTGPSAPDGVYHSEPVYGTA